jgi:hypothetical protein
MGRIGYTLLQIFLDAKQSNPAEKMLQRSLRPSPLFGRWISAPRFPNLDSVKFQAKMRIQPPPRGRPAGKQEKGLPIACSDLQSSTTFSLLCGITEPIVLLCGNKDIKLFANLSQLYFDI